MSNLSCLRVPNNEDVNRIAKAFMLDLKTFTVTDEVSKEIKPVICSICDSIPTKAQWSTFVHIDQFIELCDRGNLRKQDSVKSYTIELRNQYTAKHPKLKQFILSPETYVNSDEQVLLCKQCLSELRENYEKKNKRRRSPSESIIRGYMIGDAPHVLCTLNPVELSLITKTVTRCQSWIFFAGSHQSIKGWHTFFKGRPAANVGNLTLMTESGWKGNILVVWCGPFTTEQALVTKAKTSVDPLKVIAGWVWLKKNNYRYKDVTIPHINDIPLPHLLDGER
jgi:hypothetical protein